MPSQVGVKAKDDWTLEVTLEGPRGYFPVLAAYLAALPGYRPAVEKHGDKWTEAANIVTQWRVHARGVGAQQADRPQEESATTTVPRTCTSSRVIIPIIPVASGALPYENNELDLTALQAGDLKRLQSDPRMQKDVFRYPFPGTWYLLPQVTKPPFDNLKVRRAVATRSTVRTWSR